MRKIYCWSQNKAPGSITLYKISHKFKLNFFWTFKNFFKNQRLSLRSSDFAFKGLLKGLKIFFGKKNENCRFYFFAPIIYYWLTILLFLEKSLFCAHLALVINQKRKHVRVDSKFNDSPFEVLMNGNAWPLQEFLSLHNFKLFMASKKRKLSIWGFLFLTKIYQLYIPWRWKLDGLDHTRSNESSFFLPEF